jgi:four helix bundle protein
VESDENLRKARSYKDLLIWQRGMSLAKAVHRLTAGFPGEEKYGLSSQMRRAAVSIPSNIAEGQARKGTKEFAQFLALVSGSLAELETQLLLSSDFGYGKPLELAALGAEVGEIQKMVAAIRRKLSVRLEGGGE